jgi:hypothetical protein
MAAEMGDTEFGAALPDQVAEAGRVNLVKQLYNGEYFIHRPTDFKHTNTNDGCHIDQVMGQSLRLPGRLAPRRSREGIEVGAQSPVDGIVSRRTSGFTGTA